MGEGGRSRSTPMGPQLKGWLNNWAWGKCSANEVCKNAKDYVQEHGAREQQSTIGRLAKASPKNSERVVGSVLPQDIMPSPVEVSDSLV